MGHTESPILLFGTYAGVGAPHFWTVEKLAGLSVLLSLSLLPVFSGILIILGCFNYEILLELCPPFCVPRYPFSSTERKMGNVTTRCLPFWGSECSVGSAQNKSFICVFDLEQNCKPIWNRGGFKVKHPARRGHHHLAKKKGMRAETLR